MVRVSVHWSLQQLGALRLISDCNRLRLYTRTLHTTHAHCNVVDLQLTNSLVWLPLMPSAPTIGSERHDVVRSSVCVSVRPLSVRQHLCSVTSDFKYSSRGRSLLKGYQCQRSKVKVTARQNALSRRRHTLRRCGVWITCLALFSPIA